MNRDKINFVFFGSDLLSVGVLEELKKNNFLPTLIVTMPDRRAGRGMELGQTKAKIWAKKNNIKVIQPGDFKKIPEGLMVPSSVFIVASFGKIIPLKILDLPKYGTLNVHPSLLPKYRGPSPIQAAILNGDTKTGVSIMLLDELMDHGPIIMQKEISLEGSENYQMLRDASSRLGGNMLSGVLLDLKSYVNNATPQDDDLATFTNMLKKEDGLLDLNNHLESYRKFLALSNWPGVHFFIETKKGKKRIKITEASLKNGEFIIEKVIPEGKREMDFSDLRRSVSI